MLGPDRVAGDDVKTKKKDLIGFDQILYYFF